MEDLDEVPAHVVVRPEYEEVVSAEPKLTLRMLISEMIRPPLEGWGTLLRCCPTGNDSVTHAVQGRPSRTATPAGSKDSVVGLVN